jgi:membrane protease YdiL (CAAX protease family)
MTTKSKRKKTGRNMKDSFGCSTSQLFSFAQGSYLERTGRPSYAIVFLLPFIIFYEVGTILINTDVLNQSQVRVVAFIWLQNFLECLGFCNKFTWIAPPVAVVIILIALQLASGKQWRLRLADIVPMAVECVLLAVPLIVLSLLLNSSVHAQNCASALPVAGNLLKNSPLLANIVTGIGAGIYEELVFRLILICLLMLLFQDFLRFKHKNAIIFSVIISAVLFSAHHHIIFLNGWFGQTAPFNWPEFSFRTIVGVYFAFLFAIRGFGITAGTHAFYDIIATLINALFFHQ